MSIDSKFYIHPSDKLALDALKAIPGFTQLLKAFMKVWSEKQFYIQNMSTNLRVSEKQLPKYYNMLFPICEKLGIEVPELYIEMNVVPNAYTSGDTKPFIVMTTGLLEMMPEELIPTVLAHECGHIACHHVLYTTMGRLILNGAINTLGLNEFATLPIQMAFYYWMRCSELSADRAASICDGSAEGVKKMCMYFAGWDKDIKAVANVEEFMNQAKDYNDMVKDSKWNKTLEFLMFSNRTHPLVAVRAYECDLWGKEDLFNKIQQYLKSSQNSLSPTTALEYIGELPMEFSSKYYLGKNYLEVEESLSERGFTNIYSVKTTEKSLFTKKGQVISILINGKDGFEMFDWYQYDSEIRIIYYDEETEEEIAAAHPDQLRVPSSSKRYLGKNYETVIDELKNCGFKEFDIEQQHKAKKGIMDKEGNIISISINGQEQFKKDEWFSKDSIIHIVYMIFTI